MPTPAEVRPAGSASFATALVVGAGIGGLSAACAMRSAGWQVRVLEQAERLEPVGAGITLWPNAVHALNALGVHLPEGDPRPGAGGLRTSSGRWLSRSDTSDFVVRYGAPLISVHRGDLQQALLAALPEATVTTGTRVTAIDQDDTGVTVQHSAGSSRGAVVVLADGLASATRQLVFGSSTRPRYAGYTAWRGVTDSAAAQLAVAATTESWGRGQRFGLVPLTDGRTYWFATANAPEHQRAADSEHAEVLRRFTGWHAPIARVIADTAAPTVLRHDVYDLRPGLRTFVRGRVVLLGDAAHAMTPNLGQGACQALEDSATLGGLLRPDAEPGPALARYDALRRPRAQSVSRRSRQVGIVGQLSGRTSTTARGLMLRLTPSAATEAQLDGILGWRPPAFPR